MPFLYEIFDNPFARKALLGVTVPPCIVDNLRYGIRPYQEEAFKRYVYFATEEFDGKPNKPVHLLYNMATGSGKTLIMAGLMLYLYESGYRNFLFFVNSNNIIEKTKDNFLNSLASKYLFVDELAVGGKKIKIKEVENFEEADTENINIKFTTIQQLHLDLSNTKENSITYEDFENRKVVLIADEAHHLSSGTKADGALFGSWEGTVLKILQSSFDNILLEFTATLDYEAQEIAQKYQDKVLYRYDLAQFRHDLYSKEINLVRSHYDEDERIIQALILNLYRQELATSRNINLKPVILFKAKKTIKESEQNKENFHKLIDELSAKQVQDLRKTSTVDIVAKAFTFFDAHGLSTKDITDRIKSNFKPENCLSANNDAEAEKNQLSLNTLEDENNPIRAIFAVQKLNEGWDVLNLFDIVRLYEGQNSGGSNTATGGTTLSEAQLIGRGARYFPFVEQVGQDPYTRKFDSDITNDLKILEELYYHTKEENRYISELKKALVESGIYDDEDNLVTKKLSLKADFKKTKFYKSGKVVFNERVQKSYSKVKSFADFGVSKTNYQHTLSSGAGTVSGVFTESSDAISGAIDQKDIDVSDIPQHIVRFAISKNPFFHFDKLSGYFPNIGSITNFITGNEYLAGLEVTVKGSKARISALSHFDYLSMVQGLLASVESEIKGNLTEYEGSGFIHKYVHEVFVDKEIRVNKESERASGQEAFVKDKSWYVFDSNHGTSEEKAFVEMFSRRFEHLTVTFDNIFLVRNERALKIIDKLGRAFEPDFILFCKQKAGKELTYQVFIEPKGGHLVANDKWKEDFLKEIHDASSIIKIDTDKYLITGVPFYNNAIENEFKKVLEGTLGMNS
ncbi:MAG: DEAD/DEAH box helicase family protein [Caulobacterales bacterium]|nr:DEAD/DEAH box helicase family protein [Caulobacterales bacterium]